MDNGGVGHFAGVGEKGAGDGPLPGFRVLGWAQRQRSFHKNFIAHVCYAIDELEILGSKVSERRVLATDLFEQLTGQTVPEWAIMQVFLNPQLLYPRLHRWNLSTP